MSDISQDPALEAAVIEATSIQPGTAVDIAAGAEPTLSLEGPAI